LHWKKVAYPQLSINVVLDSIPDFVIVLILVERSTGGRKEENDFNRNSSCYRGMLIS
jgi:hypothetical protein